MILVQREIAPESLGAWSSTSLHRRDTSRKPVDFAKHCAVQFPLLQRCYGHFQPCFGDGQCNAKQCKERPDQQYWCHSYIPHSAEEGRFQSELRSKSACKINITSQSLTIMHFHRNASLTKPLICTQEEHFRSPYGKMKHIPVSNGAKTHWWGKETTREKMCTSHMKMGDDLPFLSLLFKYL